MANDLGAIDVTKPDGASQAVSILDNYQRETRDVLVGWAGIEHDLKGRHKFASGNTASRPSTSGGSPAIAGTIYINTELGCVEYYDGTLWRPLVSSELNYVYNGDCAYFDSRLDNFVGWTRAGAGSSNTRNTTDYKVGNIASSAAMNVVRAGADVTMSQDISLVWQGATWWRSKMVTFGAWVRNPGAATAKIAISDGIGTTTSGAQTGGSTYEWMQVTRVIDASATSVTVQLLVQSADGTVQFDGMRLSPGYKIYDYTPDLWPRQEFHITIADPISLMTPAGTWYGIPGADGWWGSDVPQVVPQACIIKGMYWFNSPNSSITATVRHDSVDTELTKTVVAAATGTEFGGDKFVKFTAGAKLSVKFGTTQAVAAKFALIAESIPPTI